MELRDNQNNISEKLLKKFFMHFHYLLFLLLLINAVSFLLEGMQFFFRYVILVALAEAFIIIVIYKLDYKFLRPFTLPYIFVLCLALWYFVFCTWSKVPYSFIFFLLFPIGMYNLFPIKTVVYFIIGIVLIVMIMFFIPEKLLPDYIRPEQIYLASVKITISFIVICLFFIYYNVILSEDKYGFIDQDEDLLHDESIEEFSDRERKMYDDLYKDIIIYLDQDSPWKNSEFNLQDLVEKLESNTAYISKAINLNSNMNFKSLINSYRVRYVKEEILNKDSYNRYTLVHVYTSAGFKHQSTFNKVFKQFENKTPSEFISAVRKDTSIE